MFLHEYLVGHFFALVPFKLFVCKFLSSYPESRYDRDQEMRDASKDTHSTPAHSTPLLQQQHTARLNPNVQPKYRNLLGVV